ncbi:MAG: gamma carbonic anhydrase family protein [Promethearchaeota archaeon]
MPLFPSPVDGKLPKVHPEAFVAETAVVVGDVEIGPEANVWFGAVLRGDYGPIRVGARTSIQDNAVVHVEMGTSVTIGDDNIVGHGAIVHGPGKVGSRNVVGLGSILMQGHEVGDGCIIGAGALVRGSVPDRSLAVGVPAKVVRQTTDAQVAGTLAAVRGYVENGKAYRAKGLGTTSDP